eukprot:304640-Prymnesium_polylepis.1
MKRGSSRPRANAAVPTAPPSIVSVGGRRRVISPVDALNCCSHCGARGGGFATTFLGWFPASRSGVAIAPVRPSAPPTLPPTMAPTGTGLLGEPLDLRSLSGGSTGGFGAEGGLTRGGGGGGRLPGPVCARGVFTERLSARDVALGVVPRGKGWQSTHRKHQRR